jgi:methyl-accepting chemotaxis protein
MTVRLSSLTLRARLLVLGGGAAVALVLLAVVTLLLMSSIETKTTTSSQTQAQSTLLNHAYREWILNDDQNNMYAALVALHDPAQQKLAQVTWGQAAAAYQSSDALLGRLGAALRDPVEVSQLRVIQSSLAAYDAFSLQLRAAGVAGNVRRAVYVATVANLIPSNALPVAFTQLSTTLEHHAAQDATAVHASAHSGRMIVLIITGLALPLLLLLVVSTMRSIIRRVRQILAGIQAIQDTCTDPLAKALAAMATGDLTQKLAPDLRVITVTTRDELGDVTAAVNSIGEHAVGAIAAFNATGDQLRTMLGNVTASARAVCGASKQMTVTSQETGRATEEIASAVGDVAQGAERQVAMVNDARRAAEEVTHAVTESALNARETAEVGQQARHAATAGVSAAEQANDAMRSVRESSTAVTAAIGELAGKSGQIGAIVNTITGIAEQTNLLALNAAIEAARAGEQGRGFAVVAEEVRKLAEESQSAAAEIATLIGAIQIETTKTVDVVQDGARRTEQGAAVVEQTRDAFERIGDSVDDMTTRVDHIAAVSQQIADNATRMQDRINEIAAIAEQSSASTEHVSASTEQTSASTQEIAASAHDLAAASVTLNGLVKQFKVGS